MCSAMCISNALLITWVGVFGWCCIVGAFQLWWRDITWFSCASVFHFILFYGYNALRAVTRHSNFSNYTSLINTSLHCNNNVIAQRECRLLCSYKASTCLGSSFKMDDSCLTFSQAFIITSSQSKCHPGYLHSALLFYKFRLINQEMVFQEQINKKHIKTHQLVPALYPSCCLSLNSLE